MKVANLHEIGNLQYEEKPMPVVKDDEVLVKIKCCGVCGSDIPRVFTKGTYHFPTVIGHEFSGIVVKDKKEELTGKRVAVFPLLPCFECEPCKFQNYAACNNYDYYGSRRDGGMAEYIAVKRWNLVELPENVSFLEGAMCEPISVARHAALKLNIKKGDNVLISGAGPIGILTGRWLKLFGAKDIYFFDIDSRKIDFIKENSFKAYSENMKYDCVIEGTGHSKAIEQCLDAVKPYGKIVFLGNPSGDIMLSQNSYWHILRKELTVLGSWNSSYNEVQNDWKESLLALSEGYIKAKDLVTHKFPLSEVCRAFCMMNNRNDFYNKVMICTDEEEIKNEK
ncbi:MAG: galactitol-1-phosphate 5-dehydrogenase [Clostridia bacterium]|nr:galactitol-1-phosphate 5-dehydrogenase [Clostridia bacterium]